MLNNRNQVEYLVQKVCRQCGNENNYSVSKVEAAFELYDFRNHPCAVCSSKESLSTRHPKPDIDKELLDIWAGNSSYSFCPQDEEFILGEYRYYELLLDVIDNYNYPKGKVDTLLYSLACLLYDNTVGEEEYEPEENQERKRIREELCMELKKRKSRILEADRIFLDDIKDIVYPLIGIKK